VKRRYAALAATGLLAAAGVALAVVGLRLVAAERTRAGSEAQARGRRVLDALRLEIGAASPAGLAPRVREAWIRTSEVPAAWSLGSVRPEVRVAIEEAEWTEVRRADPAAAAAAFARIADGADDARTKAYADLRAGILLRRLGRTREAIDRLSAARGPGTDSLPFEEGGVSWDVGPGSVAARHLAAMALAAGRDAQPFLDALGEDPARGFPAILSRPGHLGAEDLVRALSEEVAGMSSVPEAQRARLEGQVAAYRVAREDLRRLGERRALAADGVILERSDEEALMRISAIRVDRLLADRTWIALAGAAGEAGATTDPAAVPPDALSGRADPPLEGLRLWIRPTPEAGAAADAARAVGVALGVYLAGAGLALLSLRRSARAARMQADFVASVSHEMKTPIASVQAMAEMLADGRVADPGKAHDYAARIQGEMARLGATVRDVLDAARIERDAGLPVRLRPADPAEAVADAIEAARPGLERRGVAVDVALSPARAAIPLDPDAFAHVVHNLADNAAKFAGSAKRIAVRGGPVPGGYRVEVLDRGPGVPATERERIFERFARGSAARHRIGTGLGLALVAEHAHALGGAAWVEDRVGGGARFVVTFPTERRS
jgi:signal transduction histidine kinase